MYNQLMSFLGASNSYFTYVQDGERMEIWVRGKDWFPILISKVKDDRYRITWGGIVYRDVNTDKGLKHVLRICQTISSDIAHINPVC